MAIGDLRGAERPARSALEAKDIWRSQMALRLVLYKKKKRKRDKIINQYDSNENKD
jgi:hypothetical protein